MTSLRASASAAAAASVSVGVALRCVALLTRRRMNGVQLHADNWNQMQRQCYVPASSIVTVTSLLELLLLVALRTAPLQSPNCYTGYCALRELRQLSNFVAASFCRA